MNALREKHQLEKSAGALNQSQKIDFLLKSAYFDNLLNCPQAHDYKYDISKSSRDK